MLARRARQARGLRVCVGRDCRLSSPRLFARARRTACSERRPRDRHRRRPHADALLRRSTTSNARAAMMITGSHNPGDENGFKLMSGKASFFGDDIQELREAHRARRLRAAARRRAGSSRWTCRTRTSRRVTKRHRHVPRRDLKFVLDAGNGAGGPLGARARCAPSGSQPDALFCEMDGRFPNHHPDPTVPEEPRRARRAREGDRRARRHRVRRRRRSHRRGRRERRHRLGRPADDPLLARAAPEAARARRSSAR